MAEGGGGDNLNHNHPHNNTGVGQQNFANGGERDVAGLISTTNPSTGSGLSANDLTNLNNLQAAAAWNQQNTTSQHQQNLTTLNVVGQAGTGGMSASHL